MIVLQWIMVALGLERYQPHSVSLNNDAIMMMMWVAGHTGAAISYTVIGLTLIIHRIRLIQMSPGAVALYGTFILLMAATMFCKVITLWWGVYRLEMIIVLLMMAVSMSTAALTAAAVYGGNSKGDEVSS